jgi:septal ring factor EnvC (AmiA/AmiB activator)
VKRTVTVTVIVLLIALWTPLVAQQGDRARTETLAHRAAGRLQALHEEADRLASEARTMLGDLRRLELERQIKDEELRRATAEAVSAQAELDVLNIEIHGLEEQDRKERPLLRARMTELYKLGQGAYLRLLLSASDARHAAQASRMVAVIAKQDRDRLLAHQHRIEEMETSRVALEERTARLAALRTAAARAQAAAARAVQQRNALLREIDERRDLNAQLAGELQTAQQRLQTTLRRLATDGPAAATEPATLPIGPFRGDLPWPVAGTVRQRFGHAMSTASSSNGIEIAAGEGIQVRAIHDGTVAFADPFAGYGKLVIVDHGSQNFSVYGHLLDITVKKDSRLEEGQAIGSVGTSPAGGAGLYFELRVDGRPVDPLQWLKKR